MYTDETVVVANILAKFRGYFVCAFFRLRFSKHLLLNKFVKVIQPRKKHMYERSFYESISKEKL